MDLYEIIRQRYERSSLIITSNRALEEWPPLFHDPLFAGAALDRLLHHSERGTRVAALFYTLIESAKPAGVEPAAYFAEATRRAILNPGTITLSKDVAGT